MWKMCFLFLFSVAHAQSSSDVSAAAPSESADVPSNAHYKKILVLGKKQESSLLDTVPTVTTLEGDDLVKQRTTSLGETLSKQAGVNASSYGPTASRPIIRGLDGDRIRVLQNGIGVLDASGASQDHAVPFDPIAADSIEIVRGPVTLLYGSSAVGGVVNVTNSRIHDEYTEGFAGVFDAQTSSVNSGAEAAIKADYGANRWMWHVDGSLDKTKDLKIPGYERSVPQRISDPITPEPRDREVNSSSQLGSGALGTSYVSDAGYLGLSVATYKSNYGVVVEPDTRIDMRQTRFDIAGGLKNVGIFKEIRLKTAESIYKHQEIEEGVAGTTFKNNGNESRLELVQKEQGRWSGTVGAQSNVFQFSALGEEAFLPKTTNTALALFGFEEYDLSPVKISFGLRGEADRVKPEVSGPFTLTDAASFATGSAALGGSYKFTPTFSTALNLSYNERAPNYEELFADGPHGATFTFQRGDPNLKKEKSLAAEWSLRHESRDLTGVLSLYTQHFSNFIALTPTGVFDDTDGSGVAGDGPEDLPIYDYLSQAANIYGAEADVKMNLPVGVPGRLDLELRGDYVRGKNSATGDNLPRMSPPRLMVGLEHTWERWSSDVDVQQVFKQAKIARYETPTDGYVQADLGLGYKLKRGGTETLLFGRVNNIFDVEERNHVSFLKDYTQLGGRNFIVGVRGYF